MTVTALKKEKADERAELRRAVADAQEARAAVDRQRVSIERARQHVIEAEANVAAASAAVNAARANHVNDIASTIADGGLPTSMGLVRTARSNKLDAQDELAALKQALLKLEADLVLLQADAAAASKTVDRVLRVLLEPIVRALMAEARAHRDSFLRAQVAMVEVAGLFDAWHPLRKESSFVGSPATPMRV
jgi:hypothetical protein